MARASADDPSPSIAACGKAWQTACTAFRRDMRRVKRDVAQLRRWDNLLMVDSCQALGLCIGEAGYVQFMVKNEDVVQGRLGQTYGQLESS